MALWVPKIPMLWLPSAGFAYNPWNFNPCASCCTEECSFCSGSAPAQLQVVISGIANDGCGTCTTFNDTFILPRDDSEYPTGCTWHYWISDSGSGCTPADIHAHLHVPPFGDYRLDVFARTWGPSPNYAAITWTNDYVSKPDCNAWNNEDVALAACLECNCSSEDCKVTAL